MVSEMGRYGEPLTADYDDEGGDLFSSNGKRLARFRQVDIDGEDDFCALNRVLATYNAFAGIPDPAAYIKALEDVEKKSIEVDSKLVLVGGVTSIVGSYNKVTKAVRELRKSFAALKGLRNDQQ